MIGSIPPIPEGMGPLSVFCRWVRDQLIAVQPQAGSSNGGLHRTTRGWSLRPTASAAAINVDARYRIKSVQDDYLTCRSWNGTTEGTQDIYIAKTPKLRCSLTSASLPDGPHTYSYSSGDDGNNPIRTNNNTTTQKSEPEQVTPPWVVNDEVWPNQVNSTGVTDPNGNEILLLYAGDSRQWAA